MNDLVIRARAGDLEACAELVGATQRMTYAVAVSVLRDPALAQDAAQEAYLRAFRRLADLKHPSGFPGWLRRIVVTVAVNMRRSNRRTLLQLDEVPDVPVLDEAAMRKRLQRIRDKLRKEVEVAEQRSIGPEDIRPDFPARVIELLARPRLTDIPDNPVGRVLAALRLVYRECDERDLPEVVDFAAAERTVGNEALYIDPIELHRIDHARILRYDLTLPMLLTVRFEGQPLRVWAAGKTYRRCQPDASHLEAFHQAEVFYLDERRQLDHWQVTLEVLKSVEAILPGRAVKIVPTQYPMCTQAWQLEVEDDGRWVEILAWGVFTDKIIKHVGADPRVHTAIGVGYGLERCAMLRYGIDDIRKIDVTSAA